MMNKSLFAIFILSISGCAITEKEVDIAVSEVPENIIEAAKVAVNGIVIESAEIEYEDGQEIYELEGKSSGREYEIEISKSGEILEVEEKK